MNKSESKMVSGIAIMLMILLHTTAGSLFAVKSVIFDDCVITAIAHVGKICVSLFAFISGYGLWIQFKNTSLNFSLKCFLMKLIHRIFSFLLKYWPFVVIGAIMKLVFNGEFSIVEFARNFTALSWSYNGVWWYVRYYIFMVLVLLPLSVLIYKDITQRFSPDTVKKLTLFLMASMSIICIVIGQKVTGALCLFVFISGEICAEWKVLEYIRSYKALCVVLFIIGALLRSFYTDNRGRLTLDLLVLPMMIPAFIQFCSRWKRIGKILYIVGTHSTTMWLMHSFLYMYYNWPKQILPSALCGFVAITAISFAFAVLWDGLQEEVLKGIVKLKV